MALSIGSFLSNRYRIACKIAEGGFGSIYRAWDMNLKRPCAVKENFEKSPDGQQQFEREAVILANLSHPNLPRVFDHFTIPRQGQYLVMEYVEGEDLQEVLARTGCPLSESQVFPWIEQVCDALSYLHRQNPPIIHRDVKPANIKITLQGKAMLVDFGIAKTYETQAVTAFGARAITSGYSPPEQYGRGGTDARSDVYALGAALYMLFTGLVPQESVERLTRGDAITPAHLENGDVSQSVGEAIARAMELDSSKRFQSIDDFKQALLKGVLDRIPPVAIPTPPSLPPPIKSPTFHRRLQPSPRSLEIHLSRTLEEAARGVFGTMRKRIVEKILRQVSDLDPIQGKVVVLTGDNGVGTSSIIRKVREELRNETDEYRLIASIDLRLVDDAVDVFQKIIDTIRQEGAQHSARQISQAVKKGYQKALDDANSVEIRERRKSGVKVSIGGIAGVELEHERESERTAPITQDADNKNTCASEIKLKDVLRELVTVLICRGVRITFFIDKIQKKSTMDLMMPVIKTRGITSVLIVEQETYRKWKQNTSVDRVIYVPRLWHVADRFLRVLVGLNNKHPDIDTKLYSKLLSYLDFRSQGLPKKLIEVLEDDFYIPGQKIDATPDDFSAFVENLEILPRLIVTETQSIDVLSVGDLCNCVCASYQDVFESCGISLTGDLQRQDRLRSSLYQSLAWVVDEAREGKKAGFRAFVNQLESYGISETKAVIEQIASKVVELMKVEGMVIQTTRGLDLRGIFGWSNEDVAHDGHKDGEFR